MIDTGILTLEKLTKDGNPAVMVQTESWYDTYGTQFFAVDQVNGVMYAIKDDGQWEITDEKAIIDADTHNIVMSTTPVAGNRMVSQSISTDITPGNKSEQSLTLAESTRTPGHQDPSAKRTDLLASAQARQLEERTRAVMHELLDEIMREEQDSIVAELQMAEEARQKALEEAEALRKQQLIVEAQQKAKQKKKEF